MNHSNPTSRRSPRIIEAEPVTRSKYWRWLAAMPAIIALTTSLACGAMLVLRPANRDSPWYRQIAERALADRDYELATVCYQRLLIDEPSNPQHQLGLAVTLAATHQGAEASELIARLTPSDAPGYLPARFFVASQVLAAQAPTAKMLDLAEVNLKWVVAAEPDNPEVHALLAKLYADEGKWENCKAELSRTGMLRPSLEERLLPHPITGAESPH